MTPPVSNLPERYTALDRVRLTVRRLFKRRPWPVEKPVVVQFPVNDICDSKCQMCNIWQQHLGEQITVDQLRKALADPLFSEVRSVGINGGEPTLRQDLGEIALAIAQTLPSVTRISLITNALQPARAIARIDEIRARLAGTGVSLDVMVSLDGVGPIHDLVRGVPGNFDSAIKVLDHLQGLRDGTTVRIGCTIIHANALHLHELLDFCRRRGVYVKFRLGVPHRRLYNLAPPGPRTIGKRSWINTRPFDLEDGERWEAGQFLLALCREYETSPLQRLFYRSLVGQLVYGKPRAAGCDWQHRGVTLSSRGDLMYCAVQSDALGDARKVGATSLYLGRQDHLQEIIASKCADCSHDYMGLPGGAPQWRLLAENIGLRLGLDPRHPSGMPGHWLITRVRKHMRLVRLRRMRRNLAERRKNPVPGAASVGGILVCGWYGTETLGDTAILASIVQCIRKRFGDEPIVVASLDPVLTQLTVATTPDLAGCEIVDLEGARSRLPAASALVFGGGPLMAVAPIAEMEDLFLRARTLGVPSIVAGCGVGPLGDAPYRDAIGTLLRNADVRIFRDDASRSAAASLGVDVTRDRVTEDPALGWVRRRRSSLDHPPSRPLTLALALRDWPHDQYAPDLSASDAIAQVASFETQLAQALLDLVDANPGLRILPIPFCTHDSGGDDRRFYWRLLLRWPRLRPAFDLSAIRSILGAENYLDLLRASDALLAMRFHSIVFGAALGIPVVAIDYTMGGKSAAAARCLGLEAIPYPQVSRDVLVRSLARALSTDATKLFPPLAFPAAFDEALDSIRATSASDAGLPSQ